MYIDKSVMEEYLSEKFEALRKQKREIEGRFDDVNKIFDFIGSNDIKGIEGIERKIFLPCREEWTDSTRFYGVFKQAEAVCKNDNFPEKKDFVIKFLSMMGGFKFYDFKTIQDLKERNYRFTAVEDYRLLSNNSVDKDYSGGLELGLNAGINSHFTDNTYVMEYVDFVKEAKKFKEWNQGLDSYISHMALHYPSRGDSNPPKNMEEKYLKEKGDVQKQILPYRFPLKFLWMWARRDEVIHPLSLRAFRSFLNSEFMSEIFESKKNDLKGLLYDKNKEEEFKLGEQISGYAEKITNAKIEYFPEIWKKVSDKIMEKLQLVKSENNIHHLSLLVSLLTLGETDMTNIDELLKTHKQIILYGVPGTGKTYSAKELIKKWSKEEFQIAQEEAKKEDDLKKWQFGEIAKERKGGDCIGLDCEICKKIAEAPIVWDIMQFHPNTTYQDFIGGIIPKTGENKNLTYEVESGKFKKFCKYASANKDKKFVFIIDEINRANLSEVLGELLYALEYRDEGITIPNFKEPFVIPSNVYIIGTMNNVDKSLATFDLALRRRFGFYEVGVDCDVIREILKSKEIGNLDAYIGRCQDLNALISGEIEEEDKERLKREWVLGLESHCKIGQAYFAKIRDFLGKEEKIIKVPHLEKLWIYHLQPLIEEYIGFSINSKEVSDKLDNLKTFWIKAI